MVHSRLTRGYSVHILICSFRKFQPSQSTPYMPYHYRQFEEVISHTKLLQKCCALHERQFEEVLTYTELLQKCHAFHDRQFGYV